jgi:hypothetical protein
VEARLKRKFGAISLLFIWGIQRMAAKNATQNNRGTVCQGGIWCYDGSLRHGAPFYGDSNSKHNYDVRGMKAILQFATRTNMNGSPGIMPKVTYRELTAKHRRVLRK